MSASRPKPKKKEREREKRRRKTDKYPPGTTALARYHALTTTSSSASPSASPSPSPPPPPSSPLWRSFALALTRALALNLPNLSTSSTRASTAARNLPRCRRSRSKCDHHGERRCWFLLRWWKDARRARVGGREVRVLERRCCSSSWLRGGSVSLRGLGLRLGVSSSLGCLGGLAVVVVGFGRGREAREGLLDDGGFGGGMVACGLEVVVVVVVVLL